jgi:hypothetical protein
VPPYQNQLNDPAKKTEKKIIQKEQKVTISVMAGDQELKGV